MNPPSMEELQLLHLWLLKTMLKGQKVGVMITKPGRPMHGNTQFNQMCSPSCFSQHQAGFMFGERPRKPIILNAWFQLWDMEADLWWPGQQYLSIMLVPKIALSGQITAKDYMVHPMVQFFPLTMEHFFEITLCPYTQPVVFSLGLSGMKMHLNTFPRQHNRQTSILSDHCGQF